MLPFFRFGKTTSDCVKTFPTEQGSETPQYKFKRVSEYQSRNGSVRSDLGSPTSLRDLHGLHKPLSLKEKVLISNLKKILIITLHDNELDTTNVLKKLNIVN